MPPASWPRYLRQKRRGGIFAVKAMAGFDEVALDLLGASTRGDLEIGDVITRSMAAAGLMTSIDRLPSAEARDVVKSRLMELLGLNFPDGVRDVMEQVQPLRITASVHDRR
jgi:hypothetical protein